MWRAVRYLHQSTGQHSFYSPPTTVRHLCDPSLLNTLSSVDLAYILSSPPFAARDPRSAITKLPSRDSWPPKTCLSTPVDTDRQEHNNQNVLILLSCMKLSEKDGYAASSESGIWAKNYPSQFHGAVHKFLEDSKVQSKKKDTVCEFLSKILDENLDLSIAVSESKIWFTSHHPKLEARLATFSGLNRSAILKI